jgi:hypothetical protein
MQPDLAWYTHISEHQGLSPRCPFATVHRCPRHYQSITLLGRSGFATSIQPPEDDALLQKWKASDLWPVTAEQETSIWGSADAKVLKNFCPEAAYDHFGLFATYLGEYADEIDRDVAHARLTRDGAGGEDWQLAWATIHPMHYTDCPLYSLLLTRPENEPLSTTPRKIGFV